MVGDIEMLREQYNLLLAYCVAAGTTLPKLLPFTITANYMNDDQGLTTDELLGVKFKSGEHGSKQGDKTVSVKLGIVITKDIKQNGLSLASGLGI